MTRANEETENAGANGQASTLPFDWREMEGMRVTPAELARMCGVSRNAVGKWVATGKIALGPDGRCDPRKAIRSYLANSNPAQVRARMLQQGVADLDEVRRRLRTSMAEVERLRAAVEIERAWGDEREKAAAFRADDEAGQRLCRLVEAIGARLPEAAQARACGDWERWADELVAVECYGFDLEEYRREVAEDAAAEAVACAPANGPDAIGTDASDAIG